MGWPSSLGLDFSANLWYYLLLLGYCPGSPLVLKVSFNRYSSPLPLPIGKAAPLTSRTHFISILNAWLLPLPFWNLCLFEHEYSRKNCFPEFWSQGLSLMMFEAQSCGEESVLDTLYPQEAASADRLGGRSIFVPCSLNISQMWKFYHWLQIFNLNMCLSFCALQVWKWKSSEWKQVTWISRTKMGTGDGGILWNFGLWFFCMMIWNHLYALWHWFLTRENDLPVIVGKCL